jgi:predicted ATP-grasp superfamily ATP-dependent carboligase
MARVLVTDGEQRAALAVVRSLGRAGHEVHVASSRVRSLAGSSRWCVASLQVPDPLSQPADYVAAVVSHVEEARIDLLLPVTEPSLVALLPRRDQLHGVMLPFTDAETFRRICDKSLMMKSARQLGICVPPQYVLRRASELPADLPANLRYPVVVKPARSVVESPGGLRKLSVLHAANAKALEEAVHSLPAESFPLLVQGRILGPGVGVFVLLWNGELIAAFSHRRLREKPPSGGVSVYCESRDMDDELLARSVTLLQAFDWKGVAMVEYKVDAESGEAYLMEINGRFWGSLQLAIDAGVDFPRLLVAVALGEATQPPPDYRPGVRCRWVLGDADHLIARLRRSAVELGLPPGAPGRGRAVMDFISAFGPGSTGEVLRLSDPGPAVREIVDWLRGK